MKKEYANEVARLVNGEVKEVEKANGAIFTGIMVDTGSTAKPTIYIDDMKADGLTVEEAAAKVQEIAKKSAISVDLGFMTDWEAVKPMLRARLYNKATKADVFREAGNGFDDLVIIPYVEGVIKNGSCKVTNELIEKWNVTPDEVLSVAEANSNDGTIQSMADMMKELGHPLPEGYDCPMYVVTNSNRMFGAYAILSKLDDLREIFPEGFTVLPSSVHEVIVVPADDLGFDSMVQDVNDTEVNITDQLSNHAYRIAA